MFRYLLAGICIAVLIYGAMTLGGVAPGPMHAWHAGAAGGGVFQGIGALSKSIGSAFAGFGK